MLTKINTNEVVHCTTREEAKKVLKKHHNYEDQQLDFETAGWQENGSNTCYNLTLGAYADIDFYISKGKNIISSTEYLNR